MWTVVVQGVTHALRTNEYRDREEQFQRIHRLMKESQPDLPPVIIWDYSRLNFVNTGACRPNP
jgi:glutamyl-tRNA synthetase